MRCAFCADREWITDPCATSRGRRSTARPIGIEGLSKHVTEYPRLGATRPFEEICATGYIGGYTQVKEYVRQIRPAPPIDPVIRLETPLGLQAQVDCAEFRLLWGSASHCWSYWVIRR